MSTRRISSSYISIRVRKNSIDTTEYLSNRRTQTCRAPKIQFILFEANETCFTSMPIMSSLIGQRQWSYKEKHFSYYVYSIKRSSNSTPFIMNTDRVQRSLFWFSFYSVRSVAHLIVCLFLLFCEPFSWLRTMSKQIVLTCLFQCSNCLVRTIKQT